MIVFEGDEARPRILFYPPVQQAVVPPYTSSFHYQLQLETKVTHSCAKLLNPADVRCVEICAETQTASLSELDSAVVARLKAALVLKVDPHSAPMDLLSQSETLFSEVRSAPLRSYNISLTPSCLSLTYKQYAQLLRNLPPPPPPPLSNTSSLEAIAKFVASLDEKASLLPDSNDLEVRYAESCTCSSLSLILFLCLHFFLLSAQSLRWNGRPQLRHSPVLLRSQILSKLTCQKNLWRESSTPLKAAVSMR